MTEAEKYLELIKKGEIENLHLEPENGKFVDDFGDSDKVLIRFNDGSGFIFWADDCLPYWPKPVRNVEQMERFKKGEIDLYQFVKGL